MATATGRNARIEYGGEALEGYRILSIDTDTETELEALERYLEGGLLQELDRADFPVGQTWTATISGAWDEEGDK